MSIHCRGRRLRLKAIGFCGSHGCEYRPPAIDKDDSDDSEETGDDMTGETTDTESLEPPKKRICYIRPADSVNLKGPALVSRYGLSRKNPYRLNPRIVTGTLRAGYEGTSMVGRTSEKVASNVIVSHGSELELLLHEGEVN